MAGFRVLLHLLAYPLTVRLDVVVTLTPDVDANLLEVTPEEFNGLKESLLVVVGPEIRVFRWCGLDR
jgi:hypothetical protein